MAKAPPSNDDAAPITRRGELRHRAQALLLLETAIADAALGCHNRAYLVHRARDEVARRSRYGQRLSLLLLGADAAGGWPEQALQAVVAAVRLALRPNDVLARWQGGELVVLLPCTGLAGATRLARRLGALLAAEATRTGLAVGGRLGVATALGRQEGLELLIQRARSGLNEARAGSSAVGIG